MKLHLAKNLSRVLPIVLVSTVLATIPWVGNAVLALEPDQQPIVAVQIDLSNLEQSELGKALIKAGTTLAAEEMDKDPDEAINAVLQSIGFNPLEQEAKLTVTIADLENPIEGLRLDVQLKNSTGNLEGLLLAAPNYRSSEHGDHTIHVATLDDQNIFVSFFDDRTGRRRISATGSRRTLVSFLDKLPAETDSYLSMDEGQLLSVRLLAMPTEISNAPPLAGVSQLVSDGSLSLHEEDGHLLATLELATRNEEHATQLQQLAQGAVAMIGLFKDDIRRELKEDDVASQIIPVLDQIEITRDGNSVSIITKFPEAIVIDFLRREADLPL